MCLRVLVFVRNAIYSDPSFSYLCLLDGLYLGSRIFMATAIWLPKQVHFHILPSLHFKNSILNIIASKWKVSLCAHKQVYWLETPTVTVGDQGLKQKRFHGASKELGLSFVKIKWIKNLETLNRGIPHSMSHSALERCRLKNSWQRAVIKLYPS